MKRVSNILSHFKNGGVEIRDPKNLKHHPANAKIYGNNEDVSELVEKIKKSGRIDPLTITEKDYVISGNRRLDACLKIGKEEVPVIVEVFETYEDEIEALITSNAYREKTNEQKIREGIELEKVYAERAKRRKLATQNNNSGRKIAEVDEASTSEKGKTRDQVAEKVGLNSGRQFERGKKVVEYIDEIKDKVPQNKVEMLTEILNTAPSTAEEFISKVDVGSLDEETVCDIRSGKKTAYSVVQESRVQTPQNRGMTPKAMSEVEAAVYEYNAQSLGILPMEQIEVTTNTIVLGIESAIGDFKKVMSKILIDKTSAPQLSSEEVLHLEKIFEEFISNLNKDIKNLLNKGE